LSCAFIGRRASVSGASIFRETNGYYIGRPSPSLGFVGKNIDYASRVRQTNKSPPIGTRLTIFRYDSINLVVSEFNKKFRYPVGKHEHVGRQAVGPPLFQRANIEIVDYYAGSSLD